ncbi:hypothetical protein F0562_019290 [Nyssa sinensis]|uniref:CCT-beta n=1 Tax=Nyssa sinensis TaxID=561372 RepID=A0A5J4ZFK3_9ASTE|nr:hypothetical protein F0562_019290 [Nyssa sinensis]
MEPSSQPLATESFSYRWLINKKPSFDGLNELPFRISLDNSDHEATSEERNSKMVTSQRFLVEAQNFNFDFPVSKSPASIVHADEIFSDGQIIPIYIDPSKIEPFNTSNSAPATPISALSSKNVGSASRSPFRFLRKWRKSSKRVLQKYFGFLCQTVGCSRKSIKVDDIDRKVWPEVKSWSNSPVASDWCDIKRKDTKITDTESILRKGKSWSNSPVRSPSYSTGDWCDNESSIYEAILHCKRSIASLAERGKANRGYKRRVRDRHRKNRNLNAKLSNEVEKLLKDEATEEKGERARMASFVGAMAIADLVKTTLGPKGMDKILQSTGRGRSVTVTNDCATILKSFHSDNPAAKVLVEVQDDEVGDGTTSVVVLAGELLREAEKLVAANIHPMTIISGYWMAAECARNALLQKVMDNKEDAGQHEFRGH